MKPFVRVVAQAPLRNPREIMPHRNDLQQSGGRGGTEVDWQMVPRIASPADFPKIHEYGIRSTGEQKGLRVLIGR
jgi:hypothetical protein